jgi:hypothetical protein
VGAGFEVTDGGFEIGDEEIAVMEGGAEIADELEVFGVVGAELGDGEHGGWK